MNLHEYKEYYNKLKLPVAVLKTERCEFVSHWHYDYEATFVLEGSITVSVNGTSEHLCKGDVFICSNGDIHSYCEQSDNSTIVILMIDPIATQKTGTLILDKNPITAIYRCDNRYYADYIKELLNKLYCEYTHLNETSPYFLYAAILEIQGILQRYYKKNAVETSAQSQCLHLQAIRESMSYIEGNYNNEISIADMAEKALMSISNFSREFKNITGTYFKDYVTLARLNAVTAMMRKEKESSISRIAMDCGFNSIRTFNRVFKKHFNVSPCEYIARSVEDNRQSF